MDTEYDLFKDLETFKFHDLLQAMLDFTDDIESDSDSDYVPSSESESDSEDDTVPERKTTHIDPKNILPLP